MNGQSVLDQIAENPQSYMRTRSFRGATAAAAIDPSQITSVLHQFGPMFWAWYATHPDVKVFSVHWGFLQKTLYVRDLTMVWTFLFGPQA